MILSIICMYERKQRSKAPHNGQSVTLNHAPRNFTIKMGINNENASNITRAGDPQLPKIIDLYIINFPTPGKRIERIL